MEAITLDLSPIIKLTDQEYYKLATAQQNLRIERTPTGELVIMPPTGGNTGRRNISISAQLENWSRQDKTGVAFDSSTSFNLPNGGYRSLDASWIRLERWNTLTEEQKDTFPPICPDFAIELRSKTDSLKYLQNKMQEYLASGLRLGWLIDPKTKKVEIYRQGKVVEVLESPTALSGEDVLPGFVLDFQPIFDF